MWADTGARSDKDIADAPADIAEIDSAIAKLTAPLRQVLVLYYCTNGPLWSKSQRMFCSRRTFMRRLKTAEDRLHFYLSLADAPKC